MNYELEINEEVKQFRGDRTHFQTLTIKERLYVAVDGQVGNRQPGSPF